MICLKRFARVAILACALPVVAQLTPADGGKTVFDQQNNVYWLANADLAAKQNNMQFGLSINKDGSMNYATAVQWVQDLNTMTWNGKQGYLGHQNWQLPTTPNTDPGCSSHNANAFGIGCSASALGYLYYSKKAFGLSYPSTAVSIPNQKTGPFNNFQPYLYWSQSSASSNGFHTFSFNTGWEGANVDSHNMYVLPMLNGQPSADSNGFLTWKPTNFGSLLISSDGQLVYDPNVLNQQGTMGVAFLANADLAMTNHLGLICQTDGTDCINPDGSMSNSTANDWVTAMKSTQYLGLSAWELPWISTPDNSCSVDGSSGTGFKCSGNPMGELYYEELNLAPGDPVVPTPDTTLDNFNNLQPYLYWSCAGATVASSCTGMPPDPTHPNMEWSFSFGNGFEGTDFSQNDLYVEAYYTAPEPSSLAQLLVGAWAAMMVWPKRQ